jgi:hypothetical protein
VGVAATGGGNARSASRASTGVPKPSSWACERGRHLGSAGGGWLATRVEKRNEDLRLRFGNMSRELVPVDSWRARRRRSGRRARGTWWPRRRPSRATGVTTPPRDNTLWRSRRASREKVRPAGAEWRAQRSFGFREISEETHAGGRKARVLRVGRAGSARGDEARGDASVRDHDRVHPFRGPAPGSGGHVVRRGDARGEAAAPRRKDIQSHRETSPRGDSRAETEGGARVASFESGRGGEAAGSVAAGEVRRRLPSPQAEGGVLRARPRRRYERRLPSRVDRGNARVS